MNSSYKRKRLADRVSRNPNPGHKSIAQLDFDLRVATRERDKWYNMYETQRKFVLHLRQEVAQLKTEVNKQYCIKR